MNTAYILAVDQGTGSSKALLLDARGQIVGKGQYALTCHCPQAGWVEQNPEHIWRSIVSAISQAISQCSIPEASRKIAAIGISTQRESCMAWERGTGKPLSPLLSWQDQRTAAMVDASAEDQRQQIRALTGLPLDPMFSALKMRWILDQIDPDRRRSKQGGICLGTVDAWLIFKLGGGHCIEAGNAARTQLVDIARNQYDDGLLWLFDIPRAALPDIVPSSRIFASTHDVAGLPDGIPLSAVLADSHAALFAHRVFIPDAIKATQGTGSSVMGLYEPENEVPLHPGLCRTIAWQIDQPQPAFEGNIRAIGSTLDWLAGVLAIEPAQLIELAHTVPDSDGVTLIPAFGGLGCPWWEPEAPCLLGGMHLATTRAHLAHAAVESIAQQITDVLDCVRSSAITVERLCVDGGLSRNPALMQMQADLGRVCVVCPQAKELSALGAGFLAGMSVKLWDGEQLRAHSREQTLFHPEPRQQAHTTQARQRWQSMLARSRMHREIVQ